MQIQLKRIVNKIQNKHQQIRKQQLGREINDEVFGPVLQ